MLNIQDKILILDKKILDLNNHYHSILSYIEKINNGMQDPDLSIEECNAILPNIQAKINALTIEKQALTNQD